MKIRERQQAIELRQRGYTYKEIGEQIRVSRGSLSLWLRNVSYMPREETTFKRRIASIKSGQILHQRKLKLVEYIKNEARQEIPFLQIDDIKLLGIMAYWAEGSKTKDGLVKFTNTDPNFIRFALKWLRDACNVPEAKLRVHLRIHRDIDKEQAESYWSEVTRIPKEKFFKTTIKSSDSQGERPHKLSKGIVSIIVCDMELFHKIMGWIEGIIDKLDMKQFEV